jgi:hypothetical protein
LNIAIHFLRSLLLGDAHPRIRKVFFVVGTLVLGYDFATVDLLLFPLLVASINICNIGFRRIGIAIETALCGSSPTTSASSIPIRVVVAPVPSSPLLVRLDQPTSNMRR